jgi:hypothetical protein
MTHKQIYSAFQACKKIYGTQEVHVQLIAKQLGVTASEIIEHIEANPTLFVTRMNNINSGYENKVLGNEYPGLLVSSVSSLVWLTTSSVIREGDNGGTIILTPSAGTFNASTSAANWIVDAGTTGLTLASVNGGTNTKTLTFTGTAYSGKLKIACKAAGVSGTSDTDCIEIDVVERNLSATDYSLVESDIDAIETAIGDYVGDADISTDLAAVQSALIPVINVVDMSDGDGGSDDDYTVLDEDQYIVVIDNESHDVLLPAGVVGRKIVISNQTDAELSVVPYDTETINGAGSDTLTTTESATLICYADGKWAKI